jgi:hypothetical protein
MRRSYVATTLAPPENVNAPCYGRSLFRVGEPLPGVLYLGDLAAMLDVKESRAYELQAKNELVQFEMRPRIGGIARYSGTKVQRWLDGEAEHAPRYFKSAR